jgi:flagellin
MTINSLGITYENIAAAESVIRDTDFAEATAELTRNQVLVQAATAVLGIAAATPQTVLSLL